MAAVVAGAVVVAGCAVEPVGPPAPELTIPPAISISGEPRAFFFVTRALLESAAWPARYEAYGLFICDPVLTPAQIAQVRAAFPEARLLTYANAQSARIHMHEEPYWQELSAAFDSSLCIRNLETDTVVRLELGTPSFVLQPASIEALVGFHRDVTMSLGTDGIYLDQVTWSYPEWKRVRLLQFAPVFDIDNDGLPDDLADLDQMYAAGKPLFLDRLREEVGGEAILVANSNGPLGHPAVNGMSLENVYHRFTVEEARSWITQQVGLSRHPRCNILWAINGVSWLPSEQLALQLPSVHVGDVVPRNPDPSVEGRRF